MLLLRRRNRRLTQLIDTGDKIIYLLPFRNKQQQNVMPN